MKNKNGFTLVELLAVIVVLGVIMAIAGTAVLRQRKKANIEVAKDMEKSITDLGASIYSYERIQDSSNFMDAYKTGDSFKISISELSKAGYLEGETIKNPSGGGDCSGYLVVDSSSLDEMFKGYINCDGLYATGQPNDDEYDASNYNNDINGISKTVSSLASQEG